MYYIWYNFVTMLWQRTKFLKRDTAVCPQPPSPPPETALKYFESPSAYILSLYYFWNNLRKIALIQNIFDGELCVEFCSAFLQINFPTNNDRLNSQGDFGCSRLKWVRNPNDRQRKENTTQRYVVIVYLWLMYLYSYDIIYRYNPT